MASAETGEGEFAEHTFIWNRGGSSVSVTGDFQGWGLGLEMTKQLDGSFGELLFVQL